MTRTMSLLEQTTAAKVREIRAETEGRATAEDEELVNADDDKGADM